jgi:hypothetical protein
MLTFFTRRNSSRPARPPSLPLPLILNPSKGARRAGHGRPAVDGDVASVEQPGDAVRASQIRGSCWAVDLETRSM